MLKTLITIIYATSPHRFGSSDCMIKLNYETIKSLGLGDCKQIVCCDGINLNSRYNTEEEKESYEKYLKKIESYFPKDCVIKSKKHIGLTKNYMQAWKKNKIKTPFVLLLNHDSVLLDSFLEINLKQILQNWIDGVSCIMFPRSNFDKQIPKDWWRPLDIQKLTKPTLEQKNIWKNFQISFGNQDNCCIYKTQSFPEIVDRFYAPEKTHFIEDSIQDYLHNLKEEDIAGWEKFGGLVFNKGSSFHLDGISKAGEGFTQEKHRKGEKVWSRGRVFPRHLIMLKGLCKNNRDLEEAVYSFLREVVNFLHQQNEGNIIKVFDDASNMCALTTFLEKKALNNEEEEEKPTHVSLNIPTQKESIAVHIESSPSGCGLRWEPILSHLLEKKLLMKVEKKCGERVLFGGHEKNYCNLHAKSNIKTNEQVKLSLFDYTLKDGPYPQVFEDFLDLGFVSFFKNSVILEGSGFNNGENIKLYLCDSDGKDVPFSLLSDTRFEVLSKDLTSNSFFGFFFTYQQEKDEFIKSWSFEVNTNFFNENSANNILRSYDEISKAVGIKNWQATSTKQHRQDFWRKQINCF